MPDTDFRKAMRESESSGNAGILTDIGGGRTVAGAYQFSKPRLTEYKAETGEDFTESEFLADEDLQDRVMSWHEQDIINYAMDNGLDQYMGQEIGGVTVDPSSIMAMAHLGGRSGMRQFIETGGKYNPKDKFGTHLSDYGIKFSGLDPYGLTPLRPQMRPEGLLPPVEAPAMSTVRPRMRPQRGILD